MNTIYSQTLRPDTIREVIAYLNAKLAGKKFVLVGVRMGYADPEIYPNMEIDVIETNSNSEILPETGLIVRFKDGTYREYEAWRNGQMTEVTVQDDRILFKVIKSGGLELEVVTNAYVIQSQ
jgi:hypothetical protein